MSVTPIAHSNDRQIVQAIHPVNNKTWKDYAPVIGYVAFGILFSKTFAIGLAAGSLLYASTLAMHAAARSFKLFSNLHRVDPEMQKRVGQSATSVAFFSPILQQGLYNGILLRVFHAFTRSVLPSLTLHLGNATIPLSIIPAAIGSALVFSKVQGFSRPHENARYYNFINLITGVAYSALAFHYGIAAAMGAHIVNNLINLYDARQK